jgi:transposase-like protein
VAKALDLHPVMPSRWRQEAREGQLCGASQQVKRAPKAPVMKLALKAAGLPMRDKEAGPITWRGWMNKDGR